MLSKAQYDQFESEFMDLPIRDTKLLILIQKNHILANSSSYGLI